MDLKWLREVNVELNYM